MIRKPRFRLIAHFEDGLLTVPTQKLRVYRSALYAWAQIGIEIWVYEKVV